MRREKRGKLLWALIACFPAIMATAIFLSKYELLKTMFMIDGVWLLVGAGIWTLTCLLNIIYIERETDLEILELLEDLDKDEKIRCFYIIAGKINQGLPLKSTLRLIRAWSGAELITAKHRPNEREEFLLISNLKERLSELIQRKRGVNDRTKTEIRGLRNILTQVLNESVDYRINLARTAPLIASNLTEQQRTKLEGAKYMLHFICNKIDISSWDIAIQERIRLIPEIISDLIGLQARVAPDLDRYCRFAEAGLLLRKDLFDLDFKEAFIAEVLFEEGLRIVLYDYCLFNKSEYFFNMLQSVLSTNFRLIALKLAISGLKGRPTPLVGLTGALQGMEDAAEGIRTAVEKMRSGAEETQEVSKPTADWSGVFRAISSAA